MSESRMSDKAVLSCRNLGKSYDEGPESVQVLVDTVHEVSRAMRSRAA